MNNQNRTNLQILNLNPNVANPHRLKSLGSHYSTPSAAVLASARISRTVKYASS
jgi:hypothetical protein